MQLPDPTEIIVIYKLMPVAVVVIIIIAIGYYFGRQSHNNHIETLKDFMNYLKGGDSKK